MQRLILFFVFISSVFAQEAIAQKTNLHWRLSFESSEFKMAVRQLRSISANRKKNRPIFTEFFRAARIPPGLPGQSVSIFQKQGRCESGAHFVLQYHFFKKERVMYFMASCKDQKNQFFIEYLISIKAFFGQNHPRIPSWTNLGLYRKALIPLVFLHAYKRLITPSNLKREQRLEVVLKWFFRQFYFFGIYGQYDQLNKLARTGQVSQKLLKSFCKYRRVTSMNLVSAFLKAYSRFPQRLNGVHQTHALYTFFPTWIRFITTYFSVINAKLLSAPVRFEGKVEYCHDFPGDQKYSLFQIQRRIKIQAQNEAMLIAGQFMIRLGYHQSLSISRRDNQFRFPRNNHGKPPTPPEKLAKESKFQKKLKDLKKSYPAFLLIWSFIAWISALSGFWLFVILGFPGSASLIAFFIFPNHRKALIWKRLFYAICFVAVACIFVFLGTFYSVLPEKYPFRIMVVGLYDLVLITVFLVLTKAPQKKEKEKKTPSPFERVRSLIKNLEVKKDLWEVALSEEDLDRLKSLQVQKEPGSDDEASVAFLGEMKRKLVVYENARLQQNSREKKSAEYKASLATKSTVSSTRPSETNEQIEAEIIRMMKSANDMGWVEEMNEKLFQIRDGNPGDCRSGLKDLRHEMEEYLK